MAYKHVKHPRQRTAEYKYAFLLTFIKERRETWDRYKLCALLQHRIDLVFIPAAPGPWHYQYLQRPRDSQRWTDTNQNTISQSWGLEVEIKPGRGEHSFPMLMPPIWDTTPSIKPLRKTIQSSKYLVSLRERERRQKVAWKQGG